MGVFDKIGDAKSSQDSNPVRPGEFHGRIDEVKLVEKFDGTKLCLINMTVMAVQNGDHHEGEEVTHFMRTDSLSFLGNFKQFVSSTLACDPDQVGTAEAERVTSDEQPLAGKIVRVKARIIQTRKGNDFTKVHYGGQVDAPEVLEGS